MAASFLLAQLTAGQDVKIIKDLGLAAASLMGVLIAVFIGIGLVAKEVERRSIYSLLSKPITRSQFILGKYLGLVLTLVANLAVMAIAYYGVLAYLDWQTPANVKQGWEAAATRSDAAQSLRTHRRRTDARDGARAVLLDVLEHVPVRGADDRHLRDRSLQR